MNRREFHELASQVESHYWLRSVLAAVLPILIISLIVSVVAWVFLGLFASYSFGETVELTADPLQDFEIKWHGDADWSKITASDCIFTVGSVGTHQPFHDFGISSYEADITGVYSGSTATKFTYKMDVQPPAEIQGNPRWLRCALRYRLRLAVDDKADVSPWSVEQKKNFFRMPRIFPAPIRVSLP